jgi:hypothetical protein
VRKLGHRNPIEIDEGNGYDLREPACQAMSPGARRAADAGGRAGRRAERGAKRRGGKLMSAKSAWAVGISLKGPHATIFQFWNGKKWQVQPSQSGELAGVSVGAAAEVWAVGDVSSGAVTKTLFVHCTSCDREA